MSREEGRIKHWNRDKGFGFIRKDDGADIFVHISHTGFLIPNVGARVAFDTETNPRTNKPEAHRVSILDGDYNDAFR